MNQARPSPKAVIKDGKRFKHNSKISTGKNAADTTATHSASLDLHDPEVKAAAREILLKDPSLAAEAVAQYPELAQYMKDLNVPVAKPGQKLPGRKIPVLDEEDIDADAAEPKESGREVPDAALRISKSSLDAEKSGSFSMLVAVTQGALNAQLFFRWGDLERPEFQTMVSPATVSPGAAPFEHGETIDADLAAPQLALEVVGEAAQTQGSVLFYLNFLGGICNVWDTETGSLVEADDTFGWKLAVELDLQLIDLDRNGAEFKKVASTYNVPGNFGISALVAEFKTARLTDRTWELSNFGSFDMNTSRRDSFKALVLDWMQNLALSINYSLVDTSASIPDPTSPPTSLIVQTYPYRKTTVGKLLDVQVSDPVEGLGPIGDKNMLLYLGMTKGQSMPQGRLPWTANWVPKLVPSNPVAGCLAISREDFIDNFLVPNLAIINKATYFEMTLAHTKKTGAAKAEYQFGIGRESLPDSAFDWTKLTVGAKTHYMWVKASAKSDTDGRRGFKSKATGQTNVINMLTIDEGTNHIQWQTTASLRFETSLETFWINNKGVANASRTGDTKVVLDSVLDGKIGTEIAMPDGWVSTSSSGGSSFGFGGTDMGAMAARLKNQYFNEDQIRQVVGRINGRLERDFAFVLPGGGNFLMKNPVFNKDLDLLVDLTYNGAQ